MDLKSFLSLTFMVTVCTLTTLHYVYVTDHTTTTTTITIRGTPITLTRVAKASSILHIQSPTSYGLHAGQGYAHARDRLVQMFLVRLIGQARLSSTLGPGEPQLAAIDAAVEAMGFAAAAAQAEALLDDDTRGLLQAYADGVNAYTAAHSRPLEFLLAGYDPSAPGEAWKPEHTLLTLHLMSVSDLADAQLMMEKLALQGLASPIDPQPIRKLLAPLLDPIDAPTLDALKRVHLYDPPIDSTHMLNTLSALPAKGLGSNNWVVSGDKTASGFPIMAADPHLQTSRLPAIWYEIRLSTPDSQVPSAGRDMVGIGMPGLPGLIMGRNRALAWSFTYGFGDQFVLTLEDVVGNAVRRPDGVWDPLVTRTTTIGTGEHAFPVAFSSSANGLLEFDPRDLASNNLSLPDGLYVARRCSITPAGIAKTIKGALGLNSAASLKEAQDAQAAFAPSFNFLTATLDGHIGYQQSGQLSQGGHFAPRRGWLPSGASPPNEFPRSDLLRVVDPDSGVLATANNNVCLMDPSRDPHSCGINMHMGSDRSDKIVQLLLEAAADHPLTVDDMKAIQQVMDSPSMARLFDSWLRSELQALGASGNAGASWLSTWDCSFTSDSAQATLAYRVLHALLKAQFGPVFGPDAWENLVTETPLYADFGHLFNPHIEQADSDALGVFGGDGQAKAAALTSALASALEPYATDAQVQAIPTWGEDQSFQQLNVFFNGKLPTWLGFDSDPLPLRGSHGVIVQGALTTIKGRKSNWSQSWLCVTDLGTPWMWSLLPGGPSGRRFSTLYNVGVQDWLDYQYKMVDFRPETMYPPQSNADTDSGNNEL